MSTTAYGGRAERLGQTTAPGMLYDEPLVVASGLLAPHGNASSEVQGLLCRLTLLLFSP